MRKITERFVAWCADDCAAARFERTVVQGLIGVAVSAMTYCGTGDGAIAVIVVPAVMAVLSPLQKAIGNRGEAELS
ncbi:hypothetical protein [Raoultibacter phocaeensis]|uniref:hypothetical protein n=1 Tax=Raoultibacter phocaeensis TaxID=2479841 RepID=UPI00111AE8D6|nr:hypothetical protein [Raoultibacter phocaeensis]